MKLTRHLFAALLIGSTLHSWAAPKSSYADFASTHPGDAASGKLVFNNEAKAGCVKCHSVDGSAGKAGPDLSAIAGKFQKGDLIRSILEPSATIAIGYGATIVETPSGDSFQGILKEASASTLSLMGADGKTIHIATKDIQSQRISALSLMPEGLEQGLAPQEFADLVAYLETLNQTAPSSNGSTAALSEIPRATKGATFTPFFSRERRMEHPVWFGEIPGKENMFLVVEHFGRIWMVKKSTAGETQEVFLDMRGTVRPGGATGLLGLAFHPKFGANHKYYLKYQTEKSGRIETVLEERTFNSDYNADSGNPARELMRITSVTQDHNGGCIEFGPDGLLYLGMGDTGPQRDPQGHGQDFTLMLGKILRIDVDAASAGKPYGIPETNPFRGKTDSLPEIWALGFREPWRFTFDKLTGDLWVGDVGQDRFEEVALVKAGENHGWNVYEGFDRFSETYRRKGENYVAPVFSYPHSVGVSITGGYVYRGNAAPGMGGWYLCADFESRKVWALRQSERKLTQIVEVGRAPSRVVSFSQDHNGELYFVGYDDGMIYQIDLSSVNTEPLRTKVIAPTAERMPVHWRYQLSEPPSGWITSSFEDSNWTEAEGGFGTRGTPGAVVRTEWKTKDIWLRRSFSLPAESVIQKGNLALRIHHDEDVEVYLNGAEIARLPRWTGGYIEVPLSTEAAAALKPGQNMLAIHCHQNSGGQYVDAGLVEYVPAPNAQR